MNTRSRAEPRAPLARAFRSRAERLRLATIDEQQVSIGVARWRGRESAARLVERKALYAAKRAGRNRIVLTA